MSVQNDKMKSVAQEVLSNELIQEMKDGIKDSTHPS